MSLDSGYDEMSDFSKFLNAFINTHKATNIETNDRKNRILSYVKRRYNKYLDSYNKNYDSKKVKDEEKRGRDYKRFKKIDNRDQVPKSTKKRRGRDRKKLIKYKNHNELK